MVVTVTDRVSLDAVRRALSQVMDPEIPVVSIVDLGIVRAVEWRGDALHVTLTPTYSACPATDVIRNDVIAAMRGIGVDDVQVGVQLAPAWTTDWVAPEARRKLREYGIAPPGVASSRVDVSGIGPFRTRPVVPCPRCDSKATTLIAQFGSTSCKALYRCDDCREPFDYFKPL
ncbi:MAG TPA: 1,2-phenylacetyl-CoA epoxidase subunit PaaD [Casimicrobiaceae bacterium]|nr:1,2-phenylacetyl-CoA epoxidase subunit PaaD [Casimicrobiaceae bacterium]